MSNTNMFLCHYDMVIYWKALILSPPLRKRKKNIWKSFIIRLAYEKRYRHLNRLLVRKVFLQSWWRILHSEWLNQSFCEIICINKKVEIDSTDRFSALKDEGSLDLFWWNLHIIMLILAKDSWYQIIIWQCRASMNLKSNSNFRAAKNFHFADCRKMTFGCQLQL